jgi:hypothetical protein
MSQKVLVTDLDGFISSVAEKVARGVTEGPVGDYCSIEDKGGKGFVKIKVSNVFSTDMGAKVGLSVMGANVNLGAEGEMKDTSAIEFTLKIDLERYRKERKEAGEAKRIPVKVYTLDPKTGKVLKERDE